MQFGKVQGGALFVLGVLLLALQLYFFHPFVVNVAADGMSPASAGSHGPLAGVVGGACLLAGAAIFFSARRRDEPPAQRAVK
jgi:hypothetical protein